MENMDVVSWVLFGLLVGIVANAIDPRPAQGGIIGSLILGVAGALLGGFAANTLFGLEAPQGFNMMSLIVAVAGSLLLLIFGRALRRI